MDYPCLRLQYPVQWLSATPHGQGSLSRQNNYPENEKLTRLVPHEMVLSTPRAGRSACRRASFSLSCSVERSSRVPITRDQCEHLETIGLVMSFSRFAALCLLLGAGPAHFLRAQNVNVGNGALPPRQGVGHDYINNLSETVNPANGSVSVSISLPVAPSRGITLPVTMNYNSGSTNQFYSVRASQTALRPVDGWSLTAPSLSFSSWTIGYPPYGQQTCQYWSGYVFTDPDGQPHPLSLAMTTTVNNGGCLNFIQKDQPGPGAYSSNPSSFTVSFSTQLAADDGPYHAV